MKKSAKTLKYILTKWKTVINNMHILKTKNLLLSKFKILKMLLPEIKITSKKIEKRSLKRKFITYKIQLKSVDLIN